MAYVARDYTNGTIVETAWSAAEAAQYEWAGWWAVNQATPNPSLPAGMPAYLQLDELDKRYVERSDIHVGPEEPTVKTRGKIWFRPKGA